VTLPKRLQKAKGLSAWWGANDELAAEARDFLGKLTLDTGDLWQPTTWQREAYASILGLPESPSGERDMIEICGPVGCGKDQLDAAVALALALYGPKGASVLIQSVTRDKSKALVKCAQDFCFRDEELAHGVTIGRDKIEYEARNVEVTCGSLDGASTAGVIFDLAILNEVQEWPDPEGQRVYDHMFARTTKRKARFVVTTNAPFTPKGEWRRDRWEEARREGSDWFYMQVRVEDCPWITAEDLERKRRNMTSAKFKRWFYCEPSDGRGDLVTAEEVRRAVARGVAAGVAPARDWGRRGRRFLGLDVGVRRDHYSLTMLCEAPGGAVYLEKQECFVPPSGGEVNLTAAKELVRHYCRTWGAKLFADPHQAAQLVQELIAEGCDVQTVDPTAKNGTAMTHAVMDLFRDNRVFLFPDAGFIQVDEDVSTSLAQQLVDAEVKEGERGTRIVSKRTKAGHGDQASSFALASLGVAAAEAFSMPECVGSAEALRVSAARRDLRGRRVLGPHVGRYLGPRVERMRLVPRELPR
jgi:hypothetical protein